VYHTVNSGVTTWFDFAQEIFRLAGLPVSVKPVGSEEFPRPARRPAYSILLSTKGPTLRPWQEALKEYLA
jgi:dTDP-4-dehydrorhamnose reductase